MSVKPIILSLTITFLILISGCSYVEITGTAIKTTDSVDALSKINTLSDFLLRTGFRPEYDPHCTFDVIELCKPNIHSAFFIGGESIYSYDYFVGLSLKKNVIYIRGVPARGKVVAPIDFEENGL